MTVWRGLVATVAGTLISTCAFLLVAALGNRYLSMAYVLSGMPTASLLFALMQDSILDLLEGRDSPGSALLLVSSFCAWLQMAALFSLGCRKLFTQRVSRS